MTAQVECWKYGIDVYAINPCDPLGRTHDYSPLWLRLPFLARSDSWTPLFGLIIDILFIAALFAMPWERANLFSHLVTVGAAGSFATVFAAERGNTDLLMFAGSVLFWLLLCGSAMARSVGYLVVLAIGMLKFYPLTLLSLFVREAKRVWMLGGLFVAALLLFLAMFRDELSRIGANMATGLFNRMYGAQSIPFGLMEIWRTSGALDENGVTFLNLDFLSWLLMCAMTGACLLRALARGRDRTLQDMLSRMGTRKRLLLLVGAALCCGCFFGHQNINYRAVLLLLVVPGLLSLVNAAQKGGEKQSFQLISLLVVLLMWGGLIDDSFIGWLAVQLAWWWVVCVLLSIVFSEFGSDLARQFGYENRFYIDHARAAE